MLWENIYFFILNCGKLTILKTILSVWIDICIALKSWLYIFVNNYFYVIFASIGSYNIVATFIPKLDIVRPIANTQAAKLLQSLSLS